MLMPSVVGRCVMRVWLAAFVLMFAAVELFQWFVGLSSWQPSGVWVVLGGMGLAVLSNAGQMQASQMKSEQMNVDQMNANQASESDAAATATKAGEMPSSKMPSSVSEPDDSSIDADQDSISFKVRPLKR